MRTCEYSETIVRIYLEAYEWPVRFSPDSSFDTAWNVDNGWTDQDNPVSLYRDEGSCLS